MEKSLISDKERPVVEIRDMDVNRLPTMRALLASCQLPHGDLDLSRGMFVGLYKGEELIGCGGVELHGQNGLLRSVALQASARGKHLGRQIIQHLEDRARKKGLASLYLLTETAGEFFDHHHYQAVARDKVPDAIKESTEFAHVCRSTAVAMVKHLNPES